MFLRESRHRRANGDIVVYLQLVESSWNPRTKRAETRIVCGKASYTCGVRLRD